MGTLKGDATSTNMMGIAGMGVLTLTANRLRLPHWAREREEQMAFIASRAQALIGPEPEEDPAD